MLAEGVWCRGERAGDSGESTRLRFSVLPPTLPSATLGARTWIPRVGREACKPGHLAHEDTASFHEV